jgi:hypothetical protein
MDTAEKNKVGTIIAQQLGNKALFMIGAKNIVAGPDYLQFRLGRNANSWNVLKIRLNGLDLYDMTFYRIRKLKITSQKTIDNIYVDQLHDIIESETGLRTSLA